MGDHDCVFPACATTPTGRNRADQQTCRAHQPVVVTGSWVPDHHDNTSGGEH